MGMCIGLGMRSIDGTDIALVYGQVTVLDIQVTELHVLESKEEPG